jgi:hypothetical protein
MGAAQRFETEQPVDRAERVLEVGGFWVGADIRVAG